MAKSEVGCPCGCAQPIEDGCSYAGESTQERERHRSKANRQGEAENRRRQAREAEAEGVLAEIGLDPEAPAHTLAQAVEGLAGRLQRLAVIVGRDLEASDVDRQRENLQAVRAEHRVSLASLQERLDQASRLRRAVEQRILEAEVATSQAALSVAEANAARETAVQQQRDAELALQASTVRADEAATRANLAVGAAEQMAERLNAADAARRDAEDSRAADALELSLTRAGLREEQLRTAELLAEQAQRASDALTAALALADKHAVRDRRAAVREVRESLLRDREQLRAELAVARREQETAPRPQGENAS